MSPRALLALLTLCACTLAAVVGVALAARNGSGGSASAAAEAEYVGGWAGSLRPPGVAPRDFALRDQDGEPVSLAEYRGRPVVVTFLYSTCDDTCPTQAQTIRGALDDLGRDVPVLAVSVDPANDTRQRARRFLIEQSLTGRMRFVLGTRAELLPIWRAYGIAPQGRSNPRAAELDADEFEHSAYVLLLDGQGRQRIGFPFNELTSEGLAHDLVKLGA